MAIIRNGEAAHGNSTRGRVAACRSSSPRTGHRIKHRRQSSRDSLVATFPLFEDSLPVATQKQLTSIVRAVLVHGSHGAMVVFCFKRTLPDHVSCTVDLVGPLSVKIKIKKCSLYIPKDKTWHNPKTITSVLLSNFGAHVPRTTVLLSNFGVHIKSQCFDT